MVKSTFERILRHFSAKTKITKINRTAVEKALLSNGYKIHDSASKINAYKHIGNDRFHVEVELFPDSEVHKESELRIHKDIGHELFHKTEFGKDEVSLEYSIITRDIIRELKTNAETGDLADI